jgi:hypothetical protein
MPHHGLRLVGELIGWWVLRFLLYLVFISTLSPLELIVGAAASAVAGVGAWASTGLRARTSDPPFTGWDLPGARGAG